MEEEIAQAIRKHGWNYITVDDGNPPFQYTIGLLRTCDHPELIIFGLDARTGYDILAAMFAEIRAGKFFSEPGSHTGILAGVPVGTRRVHETQNSRYLGFAMGYYRHIGRATDLEAMQVFWPDLSGKLPFDVGCDLHVYELQPRLDLARTQSEIEEFEEEWYDDDDP